MAGAIKPRESPHTAHQHDEREVSDSGPALTLFTVRFRDRQLERAYIGHCEAAEGMRDRYLLLFGAVIYLSYGLLDVVTLSPDLARTTIMIRVAGACLMMFVTWLSLQPRFRQATSYLLAAAMFACGQQVALMVYLVDDLYIPYYVGLLHVAVFSMAFGRTNFIIGCLVLTSFYLTFAIIHWSHPFDTILFSAHFFLAGTIATAIIALYYIEHARRVQFHEMTRKKTYAIKLQQMIDRAELDLARKNAVFNVIGHVVRTPVHQMIGFSQILGLKQPGDEMDTDDTDYIRQVESAGKTLLNEVRRLGDYMRLSSPELDVHFTTHKAQGLIDDALAETRAERSCTGCSIDRGDTDIVLNTNGQSVVRALCEILRNAIDHGATSIRISCTSFLEDALISVHDNGPGIATTVLDFIDDPLAKRMTFIDVGSDRLQLGVALAHRLAEAAGGKLHLSSMEGVGTLVTLRLPRTAGHAEVRKAS